VALPIRAPAGTLSVSAPTDVPALLVGLPDVLPASLSAPTGVEASVLGVPPLTVGAADAAPVPGLGGLGVATPTDGVVAGLAVGVPVGVSALGVDATGAVDIAAAEPPVPTGIAGRVAGAPAGLAGCAPLLLVGAGNPAWAATAAGSSAGAAGGADVGIGASGAAGRPVRAVSKPWLALMRARSVSAAI